MLRPAPAALLALALFCAGCSGDPAGEESGLRGALARAGADGNTRAYVEYGDVARLTALAKDGKRFLGISGYGYGPIASTSRVMADELGFDPAAMDGGLVVGRPPDQAGVLWGDYDVDALDRELAGRGIPAEDSRGGRRWTSAADKEIKLDGPLAGVARTSELNDIRTAPGSFAYSSARAGLDLVTAPGGGTLADDPLMRRLSRCLGDVVAAVVTTAEGDATTYAVGIRAPSARDVTEVACLAPGGDPKAVRDRVARELEDGSAPSTRQPWRELLPHASADLVQFGLIVRIEAKPGPDDPVGRVMQMLQTRDLAALAGS